jgi:ribosomal protein S18 acetylase RimI-like enzyme
MIELISMNQDEFETYFDHAADRYARAQIRAGNWNPATAAVQANLVLDDLLPDGLDSEGQHLRTVVDPERGEKVGMVWYAAGGQGARLSLFICDLVIDPPFRRQGYGAQVLQALEEIARQQGAAALALHVFGHNLAARALYEKLGYRATDIRMVKDLEGDEG